jgi:hypothetical protein
VAFEAAYFGSNPNLGTKQGEAYITLRFLLDKRQATLYNSYT